MAGVSPARGGPVLLGGALVAAALLSGCGVTGWVILRFALLVTAFFFAGWLLAPRHLDGAGVTL